jgi:hypothetical protein
VRVTAVKNQIRAGTVVAQYVSDAPIKSVKSNATKQSGGRKWLLLLGAGAGAAALGIALGMGGGGSAGGGSNPTTPSVPATPPTIGAPNVSVGGPQ